VIVLLQLKDHPVFKREGNDLFMTKKITLVEALCGFTMYITHLDKRVLQVNCPQGMVIEPCEFMLLIDYIQFCLVDPFLYIVHSFVVM